MNLYDQNHHCHFVKVSQLLILLMTLPLLTQAQPLLIQQAYKEIRLYGYTRADRTMTLSGDVSGKIVVINYDVGESIGQKPFVEVDTTFIDFEIKDTQISINKLYINIQQAQSKINFLNKEYQRIKLLNMEDKAAEKNLDEAAQQLDQSKFELIQTQQQQKALQLSLSELNERKRRYSIYAPEGWIVTAKQVEMGEFIQPGHPLARLSDYQKLVVPLSVSGDELTVIKQFPPLFKADLEGHSVNTALRWINPEFNEATRKLNIKLEIKDRLPLRRGGLRFELPLYIKTEGLLIPKIAVSNRYENPRVMIKPSNQSIPLLILGETGDHLIVAEDKRLKPGMEIVISATQSE